MKYEWLEAKDGKAYIKTDTIKRIEVRAQADSEGNIYGYALCVWTIPEQSFDIIRGYDASADYIVLNSDIYGEVISADMAAMRDMSELKRLLSRRDAHLSDTIYIADLNVYQKEYKK